jgi:hypothetical protein
MSRSSTNDDPRFKKAVKKIIDNINVSVPDGMKCADYLPAEIQDMSLQQRIRRAVQRARGTKQPSPTMAINTSIVSTVSTLTTTPPSTKQKAKKVRHRSKAVHQLRKNKLLDREAKSNATKYATKLYADYQKHEKKLSAERVSAIVEKKFGIRVPKRTIQNNFKLGRIGTSPPKKGPKGHFDNEKSSSNTTRSNGLVLSSWLRRKPNWKRLAEKHLRLLMRTGLMQMRQDFFILQHNQSILGTRH